MAERWSFCRAALNVFGTATSSRRTGPVPVNSSNANVAVAAAPPGKQRQVTMCTKLLLGIGESVQSIYVVIGGFYLNQYLLEVCCMDAGFVGLLQLIVGLFDTFNDPIVGILSDMTRSRWGRRRPWLLFSAPFLAVAYFGLWSGVDVDTPMGLKFAYYLLCYAGVSMGITCVAVAIGSLVPELTTDYDERSEITAVRIMVGYVIGLFCAMMHQFVVGRVVDKQVGYRISGSIFALVMWTASWIAFAGIKEKFVPAQESQERMSYKAQIKAVCSSHPFRCVIMIYLCGPTAVAMVQGNLIMFCTYNMQNPEMSNILIPVVMGTAWLTIPFWTLASARIGKRGIFFVGGTVLVIGMVAMGFLTPEMESLTYFTGAWIGSSLVVVYMVPFSMLPDVIEDDELKTGKRREGIFVGFFTVSLKLSTTMTWSATNFFLAAAGYKSPSDQCSIANVAIEASQRLAEKAEGAKVVQVQADAVLFVIRCVISIIPAILILIAMVIVYLYPLTKERHADLLRKVAAKREEQLKRQTEELKPLSDQEPKEISISLDDIRVGRQEWECGDSVSL
mmetsp:Transcript_60731/g.109422  ORF Transcript_60731/g.109422 Transcript_60731/m.109422 type:complete len:562 (+) Transcript_60731:64-1749(+)